MDKIKSCPTYFVLFNSHFTRTYTFVLKGTYFSKFTFEHKCVGSVDTMVKIMVNH